MAFNLGNFSVKEIIAGVAQDFNDNLLYTLDQLTSASIEVSSDPTDITDKNGNIIRSIYQSKTATFTANSALLSPVLMNAQSGSPMELASATAKIQMPKITVVAAGATVDVSDAKDGTIHVMGLYGNGANGAVLAQGTTAVVDKTFAYDSSAGTITVPGAADYIEADLQIKGRGSSSWSQPKKPYRLKFNDKVSLLGEHKDRSWVLIANYADKFPDTIALTLYAAVMDPCSDKYKAAYIVIPSFQPSPAVTISLDAESTETEFTGNINVSYCSADKILYYIYFPDEDAVTTVVSGS